MLQKIVFANPRGPCAGVNRAVEILEILLQKYGAPLYVNHEIVHNEFVVQKFEKQGVVFNVPPEKVPEGSRYVFSAHGVSPSLRQKAHERKLTLIDATCPLVERVHSVAGRLTHDEKYVFYIGHEGHPEAEGVMGISPMTLIANMEDARNVVLPKGIKEENIAVLTQTTLSVDETSEMMDILRQRFPRLIFPKAKDICYATQNRQNAVKELAKEVSTIFVIGSQKSSNSKRLRETAEKEGANAFLISHEQDIPFEVLKNIGVLGMTAGASVPEELVQKIVNVIQSHCENNLEIAEISGVPENMKFLLPEL